VIAWYASLLVIGDFAQANDVPQTAKVAANCIRTLLITTPKTPADQSIARYLIPRLISFSANTDIEDPENARSLVLHALTSYVSTLGKDQKSIGMSIIVPTLLERANKEGDVVYRETSARLLELAGMDQAAFRGVVGNMSEEQKGFMESVILAGRQALARGKEAGINGDAREPTIALRMDFGG
jgi:hypothetical protein